MIIINILYKTEKNIRKGKKTEKSIFDPLKLYNGRDVVTKKI
jgi:hypothetical protein